MRNLCGVIWLLLVLAVARADDKPVQVLEWKRPMDTCDRVGDVIIPQLAAINVMYAFGTSKLRAADIDISNLASLLDKANVLKGAARISFFGDNAPGVVHSVKAPAGGKAASQLITEKIAVCNLRIPANKTSYSVCKGFKLSNLPTSKVHFVRLLPSFNASSGNNTSGSMMMNETGSMRMNSTSGMNENSSSGKFVPIHHVTVYQCPGPLNDKDLAFEGDCSGPEMTRNLRRCFSFPLGSVEKDSPFEMPDEAGFPFPLFEGDNSRFSFVMMQAHAVNPSGEPGVASGDWGAQMIFTKKLRPNDAGVFVTGVGAQKAALFERNDTSESFAVEAVCPTDCLRGMSDAGINVFAAVGHSLHPSRIAVDVLRSAASGSNATDKSGTTMGGALRSERLWASPGGHDLDPQDSRLNMLDEPMLVRRGDSLLTRCSFNVKSGEGSSSSSSMSSSMATVPTRALGEEVLNDTESRRRNVEMCLAAFAYWPRVPSLRLCLSSTSLQQRAPAASSVASNMTGGSAWQTAWCSLGNATGANAMENLQPVPVATRPQIAESIKKNATESSEAPSSSSRPFSAAQSPMQLAANGLEGVHTQSLFAPLLPPAVGPIKKPILLHPAPIIHRPFFGWPGRHLLQYVDDDETGDTAESSAVAAALHPDSNHDADEAAGIDVHALNGIEDNDNFWMFNGVDAEADADFQQQHQQLLQPEAQQHVAHVLVPVDASNQAQFFPAEMNVFARPFHPSEPFPCTSDNCGLFSSLRPCLSSNCPRALQQRSVIMAVDNSEAGSATGESSEQTSRSESSSRASATGSTSSSSSSSTEQQPPQRSSSPPSQPIKSAEADSKEARRQQQQQASQQQQHASSATGESPLQQQPTPAPVPVPPRNASAVREQRGGGGSHGPCIRPAYPRDAVLSGGGARTNETDSFNPNQYDYWARLGDKVRLYWRCDVPASSSAPASTALESGPEQAPRVRASSLLQSLLRVADAGADSGGGLAMADMGAAASVASLDGESEGDSSDSSVNATAPQQRQSMMSGPCEVIALALVVEAPGFLALGLSRNHTDFKSSDVAIGYVDDDADKVYLLDMHTSAQGKLLLDSSQDLYDVRGSEGDEVAKRLRNATASGVRSGNGDNDNDHHDNHDDHDDNNHDAATPVTDVNKPLHGPATTDTPQPPMPRGGESGSHQEQPVHRSGAKAAVPLASPALLGALLPVLGLVL